jgi:hypothetical protein
MRAIIFRKIAIAAIVAVTIIEVALPTAASAQYYGNRYWHGGLGFRPGLPFRFGAPYYYGYGAYSGYRYYDYSFSGPYEFGEYSTNQDESVADCLWRRRWANDFQGRRVWRRTSGC